MSNRDYITCANCGRQIVPRLWHYTQFGVMRTQHICPFCGTILYVTGPPRGVAALLALLNVGLRLINMVGDMAGGRRRQRF
jgi:ribosomal protein S27E